MTERVIGLGRRTREEIAKWNQMTALGFQTGGNIRHPWPPCRGKKRRRRKRDKTEKANGSSRRTTKEIVKWNQMTALRFQTGRRHQTSLASLQGVQSGK